MSANDFPVLDPRPGVFHPPVLPSPSSGTVPEGRPVAPDQAPVAARAVAEEGGTVSCPACGASGRLEYCPAYSGPCSACSLYGGLLCVGPFDDEDCACTLCAGSGYVPRSVSVLFLSCLVVSSPFGDDEIPY